MNKQKPKSHVNRTTTFFKIAAQLHTSIRYENKKTYTVCKMYASVQDINDIFLKTCFTIRMTFYAPPIRDFKSRY